MTDVTNLRVYAAAEDLAAQVYRVVRLLPAEERFSLGQQMRRSAVSVGSNIAEGCGRNGSAAEFSQYLRIALGSATELQFQLRIAVRLSLLDESQIEPSLSLCRTVQKMLNRLLCAVRPAKGSFPRPADNR